MDYECTRCEHVVMPGPTYKQEKPLLEAPIQSKASFFFFFK